mgnify:CR=1 FL=1
MAELIYSEFRDPKQMLADQEYDGHLSLHDDKMAEDLGFAGAPIEGPTHFSQFVPMLHEMFGDRWFEQGCISAHYKNMVVEGERVRVFAEPLAEGSTLTRIGAEKSDGTPVLTGTASVGPDHGKTEISQRIEMLRPSKQLVILSDLKVGQKGAGNPESAIMGTDQHMGKLYPFSVNDKLKVITELHPYYYADQSPWENAVIPLEMVSILTQYTGGRSGFRSRGPAVGMFAGLEIKIIDGPLLVDHAYKLEREIVALSESRRTESSWVRTSVYDGESDKLVAEVILNSATLKASYAKYDEDAAALGKVIED